MFYVRSINAMPVTETRNIEFVRAKLSKRVKSTGQWLRKNAPNCFQEQKHLEEGTAERAYWHYGYMAAIEDVLNLLSRSRNNGDTSIQS